MRRLSLSVVIPVHNGGTNLRECLSALAASACVPDELIVVDDSSTDDSAAVARDSCVCVLALNEGPRGPAFARNRGAAQAHGDVIVFLDADVTVHSDTLGLIEHSLAEHSDVAALFGSYDDNPRARGTVSRYKNLQHHFVHQHGKRDASTFWAGCGAIRRDIFLALGGFDEHYTRPSIEDIELGVRLHRNGYCIRLYPEIQVTHLKEWTLASWLYSDIVNRALPWSELIVRQRLLPNDLNLDTRSRVSALAAWIAWLFLMGGFFFHWIWLLLLLDGLGLFLLNADLYRLFAKTGGVRFALIAVVLHFCYLLYSSAILGVVLIKYAAGGVR